jgi:HTH-type transcriptional regulator / antitoxin HigA
MKAPHLDLQDKAPDSYDELVRIYAPRKIHDMVSYHNAIEVVQWLSLRADNEDQEEFLDLITDLIKEYETQVGEKDTPATPLELLNSLVEDNGLSTRQLGAVLGIDHSAVSRILRGERSITAEHARRLGEYFAIRPGRFIGKVF